jgi:NAD(P)-dependent dehydrogenase (short-subunit alcohol dehydrogenase family)
MGRDAARGFLQQQGKVVINGRRADRLKAAARELDPSGKNVAVVAGDIGAASTSEEVVRVATERFGGVDVLLNNAGVFETKSFLDYRNQDLDKYFNLVRGYFLMSQAAIRAMQKSGGSIINVGSLWALHAIAATPSALPAVAKGGVLSLTRSLALEFAPNRIRVNAIAPGVVETPLFEAMLTPEQLKSFDPMHPIGRNGQPRDTTAAILFLADNELSGWITGVVLPLDGGISAGRN